jgi:hypothetical protein
MKRELGAVLLVLMIVAGGSAAAQATGMTAFSAPYRAFGTHEFGGTLSFPEGGGVAAEGLYGFGKGKFDIELRGGFWKPSDQADTRILVGVNLRQRVIEHSEDFPLDGAVVFGIGGHLVSDFSTLLVPVGLSLGRRLNIEDSQVSIVPFVQPTAFLSHNSLDTDLHFALGIGGDFRLSRMFDARVSVGLGDLEGISISAVWLR